jgi:hypothetical protein
MNASLMLLGDKLGLYRALARNGPMDAATLAGTTGTTERYVREWLSAQAASGYVEYDKSSGKFSRLLVHSGFAECAGEAVEYRLHDVLEERMLSGLDVNVGGHPWRRG